MLTKIRVFAYTMKIYIIYKGGGAALESAFACEQDRIRDIVPLV